MAKKAAPKPQDQGAEDQGAENQGAQDTAPSRKKGALGKLVGMAALPMMILLFVGGYVMQWFQTADSLQERVDGWTQALRQEGRAVSHGQTTVTGFPFWVSLHVPDISIGPPPNRPAWQASGDELEVKLSPLGGTPPALKLTGQYSLTEPLRDGQRRYDLAVGEGLVTLGTDNWDSLDTLSFEVTDTAITLHTGGAEEVKLEGDTLTPQGTRHTFQVGHATGHFVNFHQEIPEARESGMIPPPEDPAYDLHLRVEDLGLPITPPGALGNTIAEILLRAQIWSPLTLEHPNMALNAWRDRHGKLKLKELVVDWPPAEIGLSGTITLNDRLQPEGRLTANIKALFKALESFQALGWVRQRDVSMARVVLGMNARADKDGNAVLSTTVTAANQVLYAGPVEMLSWPTILWSAEPTPIGTAGDHDALLNPGNTLNLGPGGLTQEGTAAEDTSTAETDDAAEPAAPTGPEAPDFTGGGRDLLGPSQ